MTQQLREFIGFTLIELLVAIGIVGILAAIAYPSYQDALRKARRMDAINTLLKLQIAQEKFRVKNPQFCSDLEQMPIASRGAEFLSDEGHYQIILNFANQAGYEIEAVPAQGSTQQADECGKYVLNQNGPVVNTDSSRVCWNQ